MSEYKPQTVEIAHVLADLADIDKIASLPGFEEASADLIEAVLDGAGKLCANAIEPLNVVGDAEGSRVENGQVVEAPGFKEAFREYSEGGWNSLSSDPRFGGQGLPGVLATAVQEMVQTSSIAFSLCPMLSMGAIDAIAEHATEELKQKYLPKMVAGEWTGTMNLTESQAGSDLSVVRTRAEVCGDHYLIRGQKIFITWGDHSMTENVIHLVLARLEDAPPGVKGISLFLVPKYLVNDDGSLGERNDVEPASVEHKLGIHASPTCVMSFGEKDGAIGYLVGSENNGLACMFTMMNHARLLVGLQGVAVSERAFQHAVSYARERVQGGVTIVNHPDVRRMLMEMKALTEAARALAYVAMASMDFAHHSRDEEEQSYHAARVALLTPIVKGWATEISMEVTSLGVQVHGGMGFIEEAGAAQYYRDSRILPIYEGTNGIQAMDLAGRKFQRDGGAALRQMASEMKETLAAVQADTALTKVASGLEAGIADLEAAMSIMLDAGKQESAFVGAQAFNFLMLVGVVSGGWQLARAALAAAERQQNGSGNSDYDQSKISTASFFAEHIMARTRGYLARLSADADSVMAIPEDKFCL